jgi:hypothetical protein
MDGTQLGNLTLPSGGTVEFQDIDDLTGGDVQAIRRTIRQEDSAGETGNLFLAKCIEKLVKTWDIAYLADPRTPEANPAALRKLKARDLLALETHVQPFAALIREGIPQASLEDQSPGSPTRPDGD